MIDEDLTDPKENPLIPVPEPEPDDEQAEPAPGDDPMLDPAYNPLIPAGQGHPGPKPEKLIAEIGTLFTGHELEIASGIILQRMAAGNLTVTAGGTPRPLEKLELSELAMIHSALRGRR